MTSRRTILALALAAVALAGPVPVASISHAADPHGDAFTYQGRLTQGGEPMTSADSADLEFRLFDAAAGGNQVGLTLSAAGFSDFDDQGLFTIDLAFGKSVLDGSPRWLEITVNDGALTPRQPLMPAPYAVRALTIGTLPSESLTGSYTNQLQLNNASNQITGSFSGSGANLTNLSANNLTTGTISGSLLSGSYGNSLTLSNAGNTFNGSFNGTHTGSGAGLTNLSASNVSSGTFSALRMPIGGSWNLTSLLNIGTGMMFIDPVSTQVGIGAAADAKLMVRGDVGADAFRVRVGTATKMVVRSNGGVAIGDNYAVVPANGLRVNGDVGIGTASPQTKLEVAGGIRSSQSLGGAATPVIGAVHKDNVIHAWARVRSDGVLLEGYGISNVIRLAPGSYEVIYAQVYPNAPIPMVTARSANDPVLATANALTDRVAVRTQLFTGGNFQSFDYAFYVVLTGRVQN